MYNGMALNITKQIRWIVNLNRRVALIGKVTSYSSYSSYSSFQSGFGLSHVPQPIINSKALLTQTQTSTVQLKFIRLKSKKGKSKGKEVDTDDEFDVDERQDKDEEEIPGAKDIKTSLTSLRVDGVLKAGLGISKAKIENEFYESKIYLNGEKVLKKSHQARVEDEVDLILGHSSLNPEFLQVSRVIIMKVEETESGKIIVKLRRFKNLLVEDYTRV